MSGDTDNLPAHLQRALLEAARFLVDPRLASPHACAGGVTDNYTTLIERNSPVVMRVLARQVEHLTNGTLTVRLPAEALFDQAGVRFGRGGAALRLVVRRMPTADAARPVRSLTEGDALYYIARPANADGRQGFTVVRVTAGQ